MSNHSGRSWSVALLGAMALSEPEVGCGSDSCDLIGCGSAISIRLDPSIAIGEDELTVEIARDGQPITCKARGTEVRCEPVEMPEGRADEASLEASGGMLVRVAIYRPAKRVSVRVLRGGTIQREGTFTPEYREHRLNECTTCRFTELVMNEPD